MHYGKKSLWGSDVLEIRYFVFHSGGRKSVPTTGIVCKCDL